VLQFQVVIQSTQATETQTADRADNRQRRVAIGIRVARLHVHLQLARLRKATAACGTFERFFSRVGADVLGQVTCVVERLLAEGAAIWRVTAVA